MDVLFSMGLDAVDLVRITFLGATLTVLITYLIPAFRSRFLDYGARSSSSELSSAEKEKDAIKQKTASNVHSVLDSMAKIQVPHSWFTSFYAVSVLLSLFWIAVLSLFRARLPKLFPLLDLERASTPFSRTQLASVLMLCQGSRRLAECIMLVSPSKSTMWAGHWLVGLFFYVGMSVAIWIEGAPALVKHQFSVHDVEISAPSVRAAFSLILFMFASGIQHDCHAYLASLKRQASDSRENNYQFPTFPAFSLSLTPHYFMECLIYLSLAILVAPEGHWLNGTIMCALIFVFTNLGVTAIGTRKWYARKFGAEAIKGKWAMVPFVL